MQHTPGTVESLAAWVGAELLPGSGFEDEFADPMFFPSGFLTEEDDPHKEDRDVD